MANSMKNPGNGKSMHKKSGTAKKYQPGGTSYADKIVKRIANDQSTVGKYIIKPALVTTLKAAETLGKGIRKYGPKVMEAASKLERGPKIKKGGTIKSKNK